MVFLSYHRVLVIDALRSQNNLLQRIQCLEEENIALRTHPSHNNPPSCPSEEEAMDASSRPLKTE